MNRFDESMRWYILLPGLTMVGVGIVVGLVTSDCVGGSKLLGDPLCQPVIEYRHQVFGALIKALIFGASCAFTAAACDSSLRDSPPAAPRTAISALRAADAGFLVSLILSRRRDTPPRR